MIARIYVSLCAKRHYRKNMLFGFLFLVNHWYGLTLWFVFWFDRRGKLFVDASLDFVACWSSGIMIIRTWGRLCVTLVRGDPNFVISAFFNFHDVLNIGNHLSKWASQTSLNADRLYIDRSESWWFEESYVLKVAITRGSNIEQQWSSIYTVLVVDGI